MGEDVAGVVPSNLASVHIPHTPAKLVYRLNKNHWLTYSPRVAGEDVEIAGLQSVHVGNLSLARGAVKLGRGKKGWCRGG